MKSKIKFLALAICLALSATACGDSTDGPATAPTEAPAPTATQAPAPEPAPEAVTEPADPPPASDLPSVDVVNVATGATVNLASFAPADQPLVLWFWAPH